MQFSQIIILGILVLGIVGNNKSVAIAAAVLLLIDLLNLGRFTFQFINDYGLQVGVTILTMAILMPLVTGQIKPADLLNMLNSYHTILAVIIGILTAFLAGRGVDLLASSPQTIAAMIFGTIIGVSFFKGVGVGPLIGAGILALLFHILP